MNVIDFLDKNNILWQPIKLNIENGNKKYYGEKIGGYTPKNSDIELLKKDIIKNRQVNINLTDYIAIYCNDVQQIDIDKDLGCFNIDTPYFESVTKKLPHYFVKINQDCEVKKIISEGEILYGTSWAFCHKNQIIKNCNLQIKDMKLSDILIKDKNYKKIQTIGDKLIISSSSKELSYNEWFGCICGLYNYSKELDLNALKIVHNWSKRQNSDKYNQVAIDTIENLKNNSYKYNIEYLNKIIKKEKEIEREEKIKEKEIEKEQKAREKEVEREERIKEKEVEREERIKEKETEKEQKIKEREERKRIDLVGKEKKEYGDIIMFGNIETDYIKFKEDFEEGSFYYVAINKIAYTKFSERLLFSNTTFKEVMTMVGQTKEYGDIVRYGEYNSNKTEFKYHLNTWLYEEASKKMFLDYDFLPYPYPCPDNIYNIWKGFENHKGSVDNQYAISIFNDFMYHAGKSHKDLPDFLIQLLANMIQHPGSKEGILLILTGPQGTFKGTYYRLINKLLGSEYTMEVSTADKVFDRFNNILAKKLFCSVNEAVSYEMIQKTGLIKALTTDIELAYEEKGMPIRSGHNFTRFMICTNENIGAKAEKGDRRNLYIETTPMDQNLRNDINDLIENKEYIQDIFDYLSNIKIKYKNIKEWQDNRPITEKHNEITEHFIDAIYPFLYNFCKDYKDDSILIKSKDIKLKYYRFMDTYYTKHSKKTDREIEVFLNKKIDKDIYKNTKDNKGVRGYRIDRLKMIDWLETEKYIMKEREDNMYETIVEYDTDTESCAF